MKPPVVRCLWCPRTVKRPRRHGWVRLKAKPFGICPYCWEARIVTKGARRSLIVYTHPKGDPYA